MYNAVQSGRSVPTCRKYFYCLGIIKNSGLSFSVSTLTFGAHTCYWVGFALHLPVHSSLCFPAALHSREEFYGFTLRNGNPRQGRLAHHGAPRELVQSLSSCPEMLFALRYIWGSQGDPDVDVYSTVHDNV